MLRLFQIEFIKLWSNKASKVLIISYFVLLTFIALFATIKIDIGNIEFQLVDQGIFNFPYIWHFNTYIASYFKLFLAIVIVSMISNEYSNRTIKQNLIDGLSKREFLFSKFITVVVFSIISTLFIFIISLSLGLIFSDFNEINIIFSDLEYLLAYFVRILGFFSFCLFLGITVKRSAFALGFLILWQLFEVIFYGLIHLQSNGIIANRISQFFPLNAMSNLTKEPFSRLGAVNSIANQVGESINKDYSVHLHEILIVLLWTYIFIQLSYVILKKRDL